MPAGTAQAIAGVSASRESDIEAVYPSVAANVLGQMIGVVMGAVMEIPITFIRCLGLIIVGSALLPLGLLVYIVMKLVGQCYVVTNRSVQSRTVLGRRLLKQVELSDIADIDIRHSTGYKFHRAGDVELRNAQGNVLLTIPAIPYPERLKHIIEDARNARMQSDESLQLIQARG